MNNYIHPITIGNISIDNNLMFAPLAGYSHKTSRIVVRQFGAEYAVTEMVSVEGIWRGDKKTLEYVDIDDGITGVQIFGAYNTEKFYKAARVLADTYGIKIIDINFGCPVRKVIRNGAGSFLLTTPDAMGDLVRAVKDSGAICTAKIRSGYNEVNIDKTIPALDKAKIDMIVLHPRLGTEFFRGHSDWSQISVAREMTDTLLIANGDINTPEDAKTILDMTNADGIMLGRGAIGKPYLFRQIIDFFEKGEYHNYSIEEIKTIMLDFAHLYTKINNTDRIVPIRSPLIQHVKGFHDCKHTRRDISLVKTIDELEKILNKWG